MPKLTQNQCDKALKLAQSILERLESGYLTRVPLLHLDELPAIPSVYFATTEDGEVLYVGKANNLATRCKISIHHKLPAAIEKGAAFLHIAGVPIDSVWYVEQVLIEHLSPVLNRRYSRWWGVSMSENVTARDFANLELSTIDFLNSGKTFTSEAAEVQKFFAFAKQYKDEYKAYYGLTITEKTSAMEAFSRFCKYKLGLSLKTGTKGRRGEVISHFWADLKVKSDLINRSDESN